MSSFSKRALFPSLCPKEIKSMALFTPFPASSPHRLLSFLPCPPAKTSHASFYCRLQVEAMVPISAPSSLHSYFTHRSPSHNANSSLPSARSRNPPVPVFSVLPKFVVLWQEVAHLTVLSGLEDLFQQILLAEAISIQNAAPKKKLPASEHLLTDRKETEKKGPQHTSTESQDRATGSQSFARSRPFFGG